jgi:hypothetical protein
MKTTNLIDENTEIKDFNIDDIDLNEYKETPPIDKSATVTDAPKFDNVPDNLIDENAYYKTGKKAGQLRPGYKSGQKVKSQDTESNQNPVLQSDMLTGALFLLLVDTFLPLIIVSANNALSKKKIDIEQMQLTEKQKKNLEPLADKVAQYINLNVNPIWLFTFAMLGIYGINYSVLKNKD